MLGYVPPPQIIVNIRSYVMPPHRPSLTLPLPFFPPSSHPPPLFLARPSHYLPSPSLTLPHPEGVVYSMLKIVENQLVVYVENCLKIKIGFSFDSGAGEIVIPKNTKTCIRLGGDAKQRARQGLVDQTAVTRQSSFLCPPVSCFRGASPLPPVSYLMLSCLALSYLF